MPLPAVAVGIAKVGAIISKGAMVAGKGLAAGAKAGAKIGSSAVKTGSRATSSSVKGAKNLKISVTNIRSVLNKKTKRLTNLKKINVRDQNNILKEERKRVKEKKLESQNKNKKKKMKMPGPIKGAIQKIGQVGGLLLAGIGINVLFEMLDKTKKEADDLNIKVDNKWGSSASKRKDMENKLDKIDTKKLTVDAKKFGNMMEREKSNIPDVKDPNSTITVKDGDGTSKKMTAKQFMFWGRKKSIDDNSSNNNVSINSGDDTSSTNSVIPLDKDKNLSSLLNNNDNKQTVILTRQVVEVPVD
tara:strand:+ start:4365 stop:5267 length:903 start_codon:yes stop_codon:yes gene_type:complete